MGLTEEVNMPYTYLERLSACSGFCSRDRSATDTGFRHQEQSRIRSQTVFRLIFGSASTRHPGPQAIQSHPRVAKESSIGSLALRPCPQVPQWHPRVAKRNFRPVFGTATMPTGIPEASRRGERGFWPVFGTANHPTGTPVPSLRGEATPNRCLTGL